MDSLYKASRAFKTPFDIQKDLYSWTYNKRDTLWSAQTALARRSGHCMETAFYAAAMLEFQGFDPLIMSFESQDGLDHVIALFQTSQGTWGSIGRSRDEGLHGRRPIFGNLRALAQTYMDPYVDHYGRITAYEVFHLDETLSDWRRARGNVWKAETYLLEEAHQKLNMSDSRYKKLFAAYKRRGPMPRRDFWWSPPRA